MKFRDVFHRCSEVFLYASGILVIFGFCFAFWFGVGIYIIVSPSASILSSNFNQLNNQVIPKWKESIFPSWSLQYPQFSYVNRTPFASTCQDTYLDYVLGSSIKSYLTPWTGCTFILPNINTTTFPLGRIGEVSGVNTTFTINFPSLSTAESISLPLQEPVNNLHYLWSICFVYSMAKKAIISVCPPKYFPNGYGQYDLNLNPNGTSFYLGGGMSIYEENDPILPFLKIPDVPYSMSYYTLSLNLIWFSVAAIVIALLVFIVIGAVVLVWRRWTKKKLNSSSAIADIDSKEHDGSKEEEVSDHSTKASASSIGATLLTKNNSRLATVKKLRASVSLALSGYHCLVVVMLLIFIFGNSNGVVGIPPPVAEKSSFSFSSSKIFESSPSPFGNIGIVFLMILSVCLFLVEHIVGFLFGIIFGLMDTFASSKGIADNIFPISCVTCGVITSILVNIMQIVIGYLWISSLHFFVTLYLPLILLELLWCWSTAVVIVTVTWSHDDQKYISVGSQEHSQQEVANTAIDIPNVTDVDVEYPL